MKLHLLLLVSALAISEGKRGATFGKRNSVIVSTSHRRHDDEDAPLAFLVASSSTTEFHPEDDGPLDRDAVNEATGPKFWPPWPFSRLQQPGPESSHTSNSRGSSSNSRSIQSTASMVWAFSKTTTRVAVRNVQEVGSQLWFHMPPASTPLILLASLPRKQKLLASTAAEGGGTLVEEAIYKTLIPLWSNAFVRNLSLAATGLAVTSWAHWTLRRKRLLTPLALAEPYRDINRAVLPPFLPEQVPVVFLEDIVDDEDDTPELPAVAKLTAGNNDSASTDDDDDDMALPPRLRRHWKQFAENAPKPHTLHTRLQEWQRMRRARECERKNAHRLAVFDELVALQTLRKKAAARRLRLQQQQKQWYGRFGRKSGNTETVLDGEKDMNNDSVGYALVTGASKGIGRAIAVELARWEVPLILVARDVDALTALAYDLEACYGVDCCVLPADLSKPTTAEDIYKTVTDAGLNVDVSSFCLVAQIDCVLLVAFRTKPLLLASLTVAFFTCCRNADTGK